MVGKNFVSFCLLIILFAQCSCNNISENNKINITVKIIDSFSSKPRSQDVVILKEIKWGFPMRKSVKLEEKKTDSLGRVKFVINQDKAYIIWSKGAKNSFGSIELKKNEMKNNQQVIINIIPSDKKKFKID